MVSDLCMQGVGAGRGWGRMVDIACENDRAGSDAGRRDCERNIITRAVRAGASLVASGPSSWNPGSQPVQPGCGANHPALKFSGRSGRQRRPKETAFHQGCHRVRSRGVSGVAGRILIQLGLEPVKARDLVAKGPDIFGESLRATYRIE